MPYKVAAGCTYSSSTNKTNALNALNSFLAGYTYTPTAGRYSAGINSPTTTSITVSILLDDTVNITTFSSGFRNAVNGTTKYTLGLVAVYKV